MIARSLIVLVVLLGAIVGTELPALAQFAEDGTPPASGFSPDQTASSGSEVFNPLSEVVERLNSKLPPFETKADPRGAPEPPLGSALFGGQSITIKELFETHADPPPPGGRPWPDISEPGPDFGDFPNSSFTLPKGRSYFEFAPLSLLAGDSQGPPSYSSPFLFRYGVTDDLEFRVFGSGIAHVGGDQPTTGWSPIAFDFKIHLWDDKREWMLPASSLEVYVQTPWGSTAFDGGWQPSLNMNFDLPLADKTNLEWTIGLTGVQDAVNVITGERFIPRLNHLVPTIHRENLNVNQFSVQWALEQDVNDKLQVFLHGFYNGAVIFQQGSGTVVGGGFFYKFSPRVMGFSSLNWGLSKYLPPIFTQIGFAVAL